MSKDARVDHRVDVKLLVDYSSNGSYLFDFCRDLGTGGVFIETDKPQPIDSKIDLTFTIPDSKSTVTVSGKVIWVQAKVEGKDITPGMGVQFDELDGEKFDQLKEFVERYHTA